MLKKRAVGVLGVLACAAVSARGAVVFTENFDTGGGTAVPTGWTANNVPTTGIYTSAPSVAPPDAAGSTASFVQADGDTSRISKAFTPDAAATSFKLSWYQYINTSSLTQRAIGQLSTGTVSTVTPGAGTFGFFRLGTANVANYAYIYSNGSTQTVQTTTAVTTGWHLLSMTVTPGTSVQFSIDNGTPTTLTGAATVPNMVTLGNNVANGTVGTPDTSEWFDSVKLEQFAPAATKATAPSPASAHTGDNPAATTLAWTPAASNLTSQDLLFGTDPTLTAAGDKVLTAASAATNSFNPGALLPNTTYYWEVVSNNALGDPTAGDIWSFTTAAVPEPTTLSLIGLTAASLLGRKRRRVIGVV